MATRRSAARLAATCQRRPRPPCSPRASCSSWCSSSYSSYSSVNADQVSHFDALASSWWDPHGPSRLLHLMNPLRHDFIRACLASSSPTPPPDESLCFLDIGCGGGIFAESAARLASTRRVVAIDPTPSVLAVARAHARRDPGLTANRLTYQQTTVEQLPVPAAHDDSGRFDVVTLFEVLEHVDDPATFLARVRPFVRPGGWLVMSTIARTWTSWLTTKLVAEHLLRIVPPGTHDWHKYINEHELRRFLTHRGWQSPRALGVVYIPGLGWRPVEGSEALGNYFLAVQRSADESKTHL
ncbi:hypothetical protein CDD82_6568 [Ophiocordyceps australis]|uniref:Ubiquinone biosynthesis O-methyltransferase, mitochondrial n=1 Tax=Ophiocordyceps australis TaxID=1399860 RepID=A0A2C5Y2Y5_9HYPO|nr:hypothetical protein CDD82_6568 [Ophiocordyceps australis]